MSKSCNRCGTDNLYWNKKHYEKTGKWQLIDHKNKKGEWCVRNTLKTIINQSKEKPRLCEYCKESNFGLCRTEKDYKSHVRAYHPKKEILTNLDYMFMHCGLKGVNIINWKSDLHYEKYKLLIQ